jgi:hypothetical protein
MWREFRDFLLKQNALALAVGVIVGAMLAAIGAGRLWLTRGAAVRGDGGR